MSSNEDEETSSMKGKNPLEKRFNTIRQRSNSFWKRFSKTYSQIIVNYFKILLPISFVIAVGLTALFFLFFSIRNFGENDFLLQSGDSMTNFRRLREIFGDDSMLRVHQQLKLYPSLDLIIKRKISSNSTEKNQTNMLKEKIYQEVLGLNELIQLIDVDGQNYSSLCVRHNRACLIDGNYLLSETFRQSLSNLLPPANGYFVDNHGANGIPQFMFGKNFRLANVTPIDSDYVDENENEENLSTTSAEPAVIQIISHVPLFRLRYSLKSSTDESKRFASKWEKKATKFLVENYQSDLIEIAFSTSDAISETVAKKSHDEGLVFLVTFLIFFIFVIVLSMFDENRSISIGILPICGFISLVLSIGTTFGLLTLFQVEIVEPMALVVFGVGIVEAMRISIVCGETHRVLQMSSDEETFTSIIESTNSFFLITTLSSSIIYFLLASLTPMISSNLICLTLILHLFVVYLIDSTFFSSCLFIILRRIESTRVRRQSSKKIFSFFRFDSISKRFFSAIFCLLSLVGIFFSVSFVLSIETRLFDDIFLPSDAQSLRSYMKSQFDDFNVGPVIMFTIPQSVDYNDSNVRQSMSSLLEQCQTENRINDFRLLWTEKENLDAILYEKTPLEFRISPFSTNDLVVKDENNRTTITASRFYCQYKSLQGDREDIRTMNNIFTYAKQSSLPSVFAYSLIFPQYESLAQIRFETFLLAFLFVIVPFSFTFFSFVSLKISLSISFHLLFLFTSTLAVLSQIHQLTLNFANAIWLLILPLIFTECFIHSTFSNRKSKWKYNRVFLSLFVSFVGLYVYPIESYVFIVIRNSLIYQSIIGLILINLTIPSCHFFLFKSRNIEKETTPIQMTTSIPEQIQLENGEK